MRWLLGLVFLAAALLTTSDAIAHFHSHGLSDALATAGVDIIFTILVLLVLGWLVQ